MPQELVFRRIAKRRCLTTTSIRMVNEDARHNPRREAERTRDESREKERGRFGRIVRGTVEWDFYREPGGGNGDVGIEDQWLQIFLIFMNSYLLYVYREGNESIVFVNRQVALVHIDSMFDFPDLKLHMGMGVRDLMGKMTGVGQKDGRVRHMWKMPDRIVIGLGQHY